MAKVHGDLGPVQQLMALLKASGMAHLNSFPAMRDFLSAYPVIIANLNRVVEEELYLELEDKKTSLTILASHYNQQRLNVIDGVKREREELKNKIDSFSYSNVGAIKHIILSLRYFSSRLRLRRLSNHFEKVIESQLKSIRKMLISTEEAVVDLEENFQERLSKLIQDRSGQYEAAKRVLDSNMNLYWGAHGEYCALEELSRLTNDYHVVNNYNVVFNPPIFNKSKNQRIFSIQIDHVVISHAGVFVIETKHWSQKTIDQNSDYTPIDQIERNGYAVFCQLNSLWKKKIPVKSIVLMVNANQLGRTNFAKVLNLEQINGYIRYFPPVLSDKEVSELVDFFSSRSKRVAA